MVDEDFRHHEIGDDNGDNHGIILVDPFEIFVSECYGREASWLLYVDPVDVNIFDGMKMMLSGLAR